MLEFMKIEEDMLDACARMYVETFNAEPWLDHWTYPTARQRLCDILHTPGFHGLLILEHGELRGAAFGHIEAWYEGSMFYLREMFIANEHRGRGFGAMLLQRMEEELKPRAVHTIYLFTATGDRTEAFYEQNGFRSLDEMRMMTKELG